MPQVLTCRGLEIFVKLLCIFCLKLAGLKPPLPSSAIPVCPCNGVFVAFICKSVDLDGLAKLTDTLHEKLLSSGVNAIPLDSEMLQLDYQATVRKGQEEAELTRITLQRVQTNCAALSKAMSMPRK